MMAMPYGIQRVEAYEVILVDILDERFNLSSKP